MPFESEHSARVRSPGDFEEGSFRSKDIEGGIRLILGRLKGETAMTTQAYRFHIDHFTAPQAQAWLTEHKIKPISFEPATGEQERIRVKVNDYDYFPDSEFEMIVDHVAGIYALYGETSEGIKVNALRFEKTKGWTVEKAVEWAEKNGYNRWVVDVKWNEDVDFERYVSVKNVELWREGISNDDRKIKRKEVQDIFDNTVEAYKDGYYAPIKVGHGDKEEVAKGIVDNLKLSEVEGKLSLSATFKNIPEKIAELIKKKLLGMRSIEYWPSFRLSSGKKLGKILKAVALLGTTTPALHYLYDRKDKYDYFLVDNNGLQIHNEIVGENKTASGGLTSGNSKNKKSKKEFTMEYTHEQVGSLITAEREKTENVLKAEFETEKSKLSESFETEKKVLTEERDKLKKEVDEFAKKAQEDSAKAREAYIDGEIKEGRLLPKQRDTAIEMYGKLCEVHGDEDGKKKISEFFNAIPKGMLTEVASADDKEGKEKIDPALGITKEDVILFSNDEKNDPYSGAKEK